MTVLMFLGNLVYEFIRIKVKIVNELHYEFPHKMTILAETFCGREADPTKCLRFDKKTFSKNDGFPPPASRGT